MSEGDREYGPRDVVWALLFHQHTARVIKEATRFSDAKYEVEGKVRPLLVMTLPTQRGTQQTLEFTTVRPQAEIADDFLHHWDKDGNRSDKLFRFGPRYGIKDECYLDIAESHPIPKLRTNVRKHQTTLDQMLFDHIYKEHHHRRLGYQVVPTAARGTRESTNGGWPGQ